MDGIGCLMPMRPDHVSEEDLAEVLDVRDKEGEIMAAHRNMRTEQLEDGGVVECLYTGHTTP